jgi:hypothetical protein
VLLVLVVVYIVVAIHRPAPAPVKNDHCSRLSFDTRHPQDSQQCQRRRFPPIARRSRDYSLIVAMGSGRGPWLSKMSLHERDRDLLQSPRYVKRRMNIDLEDHAAVLGGEVDATEGQAQ